MKENITLRRILLAVLVASGLAGASAQAQYSNTFDTAFSPWRWDFGAATPTATRTVTWASGATYDAQGNALSGSAKLAWNFDHETDGNGGAAFTADVLGSPGTSFVGGILSFDIYVDPSSTPGLAGDYGYFELIARNTDGYGYNNTGGGGGLVTTFAAAPGVWTHVSRTLDATTGNLVRAITVQDYNDIPRGIVGPMAIYIDNLALTPIPEPSTMALVGLGLAGLMVIRRQRRI